MKCWSQFSAEIFWSEKEKSKRQWANYVILVFPLPLPLICLVVFHSSVTLLLLPSLPVSFLLSLLWFLLPFVFLCSLTCLPSSLILLLLTLSFTPLQHNRTCQLSSITQCIANYFSFAFFSFHLSFSWHGQKTQKSKLLQSDPCSLLVFHLLREASV